MYLTEYILNTNLSQIWTLFIFLIAILFFNWIFLFFNNCLNKLAYRQSIKSAFKNMVVIVKPELEIRYL